MGIYLPTTTCLIEESEIPSVTPNSYHAVQHLLEKYWENTNTYLCTTRGYGHLEEFSRLRHYLKLKELSVYGGEVGFTNQTDFKKLQNDLNETESLLLNKSKEILQNHLIEQKNREWMFSLKHIAEFSTEKYKQIHIENIKRLKQLDLTKIYKEAPLLKEISDFDLQDQFKELYHTIITVFFWLKTQIYVVNKGIELNKSFMYVMISSLSEDEY